MTAWQSVCALIVAIECAAIGACAYMLGRTYWAVKNKIG